MRAQMHAWHTCTSLTHAWHTSHRTAPRTQQRHVAQQHGPRRGGRQRADSAHPAQPLPPAAASHRRRVAFSMRAHACTYGTHGTHARTACSTGPPRIRARCRRRSARAAHAERGGKAKEGAIGKQRTHVRTSRSHTHRGPRPPQPREEAATGGAYTAIPSQLPSPPTSPSVRWPLREGPPSPRVRGWGYALYSRIDP